MSTAISIPQEPAFIPEMSLPAEVEGATDGFEARAKGRVLDCPEALKSLDKNAEDRWRQLSRTARQDFLKEFAIDELVFRLQCQAERERRADLPYDDNARTTIWDTVSCRLGTKVRFTRPATVERTSPHPGEDLRQASTFGSVTRDIETYATLIGRVISTLRDQRLLRLRAIKLIFWAEARKIAAGYEPGFSLMDIVHASELAPGEDGSTEAQLLVRYPMPSSAGQEFPARAGRKKLYQNSTERQRACRARKRLSRNIPETVENGLGA